MNHCVFSADRKYRYLLVHRLEPGLIDRHCMWIALNPSIADESGLDNTLARIRSFSGAAGFNAFYMVNLFGLVSTNRKALKHHPDPVGPGTDSHIRRIATLIPTIFVAWGTDGRHQNRGQEVMRLLAQLGRRDLRCFGTNKDGSPRHPLYLSSATKPVFYRQPIS